MFVVVAALLLLFAAALHYLRDTDARPRWPFLVAAALCLGTVLVTLVMAVLALIAGRDVWNTMVSGSRSSQTVTLWLVLVVGPALLATCGGLLVTGGILRIRQRRRSGHAASSM